METRDRERAFFVGASLAVIPALALLPAIVFLLITPVVPHAGWIAAFVLPVLALVGAYGLWQLAMGAVQRPFGMVNALCVGGLLVILIIAAYTGLFLALVAVRL